MTRRRRGSLRKRAGIWFLRYYVGERQVEESARTGDEREARQLLAQRVAELQAGTWRPSDERAPAPRPAAPLPVVTVEAWLAAWLARRAAQGVRAARDEDRWWREYVGPALVSWTRPDGSTARVAFGSLELGAVERDHVRELVSGLSSRVSAKTGRPLAPRTVLNLYRTLSTAFADAVIEKRIAATPCTLRSRRRELPKLRDRDPAWRASSVYTREEAEQLVSDPRIPPDRRAYYALAVLAGLRTSEVAGLRWRDVDSTATPLGRLTVERQADGPKSERPTKTGEARHVPIVPALAAVLASWRTDGFPLLFGREPRPEDPLVPSRADASGRSFRVVETMHSRLVEDRAALGMRRVPHAQHALRATFLSLLEVDGANMAIARRATHSAPADVVGGYIRIGWADVCREVGKLGLELRAPGEVLPLTMPRRSKGRTRGEPRGGRESGPDLRGNSMGPAGVEPAHAPL